ncbi:MAG TPA: NEW3 domain-containing protein [Candidatus Methanofastidiosa archaeon]|nr:NEW3 domain-containing protein [Candidatus Methanofastidiosa archaeon]
MRRYPIGLALALIVLLSAVQVAGVTYEHYIVWDEQERVVYAGNSAEFNLTIVTTAQGTPTSTPSPTNPPTTWPTPPPPPDDSASLGPLSYSMNGAAGAVQSSFSLADIKNVYLSATAPQGWDVELSADTLYMNGEDSEEVLVEVTSPSDAEPGVYSILFTAKMEGVDKTVELLVRVLDPFDVFISNISYSPAEPQLGQEITFTADVTLDGNVLIPTKTVALYINDISQSKLASVEVDIDPNSTETISLTWTASQIGDFTARLYLNPTSNESDLTNNEISTTISILPAEDPCTLADDTYALALGMYDEDCQSAMSTLAVAKALYEQCGDTNGATLCQELIDKCEDYTLAEELESQGDVLAANGDCEGAIAKWEAAIAIYEDYGDQDRIDSLNTKIDNCELEPEPEPQKGFFGKYWKWIVLLLVALLLLLILLYSRRKKEDEGDTTFGIYPSEGGAKKEPDSLFGGPLEEELEIPPVIPIPLVTRKDEDEISKFMADMEKYSEILTMEMIKQDLKGAIARYSSLIDRRNSLVEKMDDATRRRADKMIKALEDRIFEAL